LNRIVAIQEPACRQTGRPARRRAGAMMLKKDKMPETKKEKLIMDN